MAINVSQAFHRTSANPIDESLALTKAQMLTVNDNLMPNKYLTVCQDDGKIYLYDKANTSDPTTGKFRVFEGGGGQGGSGITIDATLLASGWDSNTKQQTVTFTGYESTMGGVIGVPTSATSAQKSAYADAKIDVVSISGTSFTFECEEIPSIDLLVTLYAGGSGGGGASLPSGGTTGQVLAKHSDTDGDVEWKDDAGGQTIQYSTMPTASVSNLGQIVQFIGATDANYTNGLFYECVSDGQSTPTYSWEIKDVQTYPEVDLTNVFSSGMPVASVTVPMVSYRTEEQVVGTWIDNKPLYQKTVYVPSLPNNSSNSTPHGISNIKLVADVRGTIIITDTVEWSGIPMVHTATIGNQVKINVNTTDIIIATGANRSTWSAYITIQYTKTTDD